MDEVGRWLAGLGLERYAELFAANDINLAVLRSLSDADLKELGVRSLGHRRRLLDAITRIGARGPSERRHLTIMFTDLVGSTELAVRLDPEEMREVLRAYRTAATGEIERHGGYVAKLMGDGILAYFGWPRAQEYEAERAVRAGLAVVAAVGRPSPTVRGSLAVRIGIASGMVAVGEVIGEGSAREATVVGEAPSLAARLQALAPPDGIVVADTTRRLLGGLFALAPLGSFPLKGFAEPIPAWRIIGEAPQVGRFAAAAGNELLPMIGRDREQAELLETWRDLRGGPGRAILIEGEAGIGKSRLVHALHTSLAGEPHTAIHWQCSPFHGESALWPVLRELLGNQPQAATVDALERRLKRAGMDAAKATGLLADLLGIEQRAKAPPVELGAEPQRAALLALIADRILRLAARGPLLLVVEDAHWADASTVALLRLLLGRIGEVAALVVVTARPEGLAALTPPPRRLSLGRLDRASVAAIAAGHAGGAAVPARLIDLIAERTDGVPLFVEELAKALVERGWAGGQDTLPEVPASLHDTLMARLDRLGPAKDLAQVAACIGREFDAALLGAVADQPAPELRRNLRRLCAAEILVRQGTGAAGTRYGFRQALVQDAAYESLLKSRRREIHNRLLTVVEDRGGPGVAERAGHHAAAAELWPKALHHYGRAGTAALERAEMDEGLALIGRALAAGQRLQADVTAEVAMIELRRTRSWAYLRLGDTVRVMADLRDAEAGAGRFGMRRLSCQLRAQRAYVEGMFGGHAWRAVRYGREATRIAAAAADRELGALARLVLAQSFCIAGDHVAALAELEIDSAAYPHELRVAAMGSGGTLAVEGLALLGECLGQLDRPAEALARGREARDAAAETGLPWDLHVAGYHLARTLLGSGDALGAQDLAQEGLALGQRHGWATAVALHQCLLGRAAALAGRTGAALEWLDAAAAGCSAARLQWAYTEALLARSEARLAADPAEALAGATQALDLARTHGYRAIEQSALRLVAS
ncbi:MAG: adenylate/guanylate cyclase domain-containing protein [Geminicoccaceae bacterium]